VHARGTHAELLNVHSKAGVKLKTKSSVDFVTQQIVIAPGESFVDRGDEIVHTALNRGTANLEFWATYLVPGAPGTAARIDAASPGTCPF
jgi:hypothetical protein